MYLPVLALPVVVAVLVGRYVSVHILDLPSAQKNPQETMRAITYDVHGDVNVLQFQEAVPRPIPRDDQILVEVKASAINPVDFKYRRNPMANHLVPKPKIPGYDLAGVVVAKGKDVTKFQVGDRVAAMIPLLGSQWGALAEYTPVKESFACQLDDSIDFESAAAFPLAGLTVVQKLKKIPSPRGKKILIHAGAGGVGTIAIQYAKHVLGMFVATTASSPKADFLQSLGADIVINYREKNFAEEIQGYDAVLDTMSYLYEEMTLNKDSHVLADTGIYLNVLSSDWSLHNGLEKTNGMLSIKNLLKHSISNFFKPGSMPQYHFWYVYPDGSSLQHIMDLVKDGKLHAVIDGVYELKDAAEAFRRLESGRVTGKVVLRHS